MDELQFWQTSAFACVIFMMFMYSILDGFDLGLGALIGHVAANDDEKKVLLRAISPFWDGNEVWLVIAVSVLFAAFPPAFSKLLPSFYLPFLFIIMLFICRAVSLEFAYSGKGVSKLGMAVFSISSILASSLGILFLGVIVAGVPTDNSGIFKIGVRSVLDPLPLMFAASWFILMLLHSVSYFSHKCDEALKERLMKFARRMWPVFAVLFAAGIVLLHARIPQLFGKVPVIAGIAMVIAGGLAYRAVMGSKKSSYMFVFSALAMGGVWMIVAGAMFPNIVNPGGNESGAMTIYNSSAPLGTLRVVVSASLVGMTILIAYVFFVYRILRDRIGSNNY